MRESAVPSSDQQLLRRIKGEYLEMPGLRLTCQQAQRLWGLDLETCTKLLSALVDLRFLFCAPDGRYTRLTDGSLPNPSLRMAKAGTSPRDETVVAGRRASAS